MRWPCVRWCWKWPLLRRRYKVWSLDGGVRMTWSTLFSSRGHPEGALPSCPSHSGAMLYLLLLRLHLTFCVHRYLPKFITPWQCWRGSDSILERIWCHFAFVSIHTVSSQAILERGGAPPFWVTLLKELIRFSNFVSSDYLLLFYACCCFTY